MDVLEIARWQFGIITVYHFVFVPLTIGLTAIVAGMETAWIRTQRPEYLRLTKFFGKLLLINFALGLVTGSASLRYGSLAVMLVAVAKVALDTAQLRDLWRVLSLLGLGGAALAATLPEGQ